jgi:hypothetical protein
MQASTFVLVAGTTILAACTGIVLFLRGRSAPSPVTSEVYDRSK